jgi:hypothetical protein
MHKAPRQLHSCKYNMATLPGRGLDGAQGRKLPLCRCRHAMQGILQNGATCSQGIGVNGKLEILLERCFEAMNGGGLFGVGMEKPDGGKARDGIS